MRKLNKSSLILRVALIVLCLALFSAHLSSGMLAKFTMRETLGNSARVAGTRITITSPSDIVIADDGSAELTFNVKNDSEVALQYSIVITPKCSDLTAAQLANAFTGSKIGAVSGVYNAADGSYTFSTDTQVVPGEDVDMTLTFGTNDIVSVTTGSNSLIYNDITLDISAKAVQLD